MRRAAKWLALLVVVSSAIALGACSEGQHTYAECSDHIPCPDGMTCSADGICVLRLPVDAGIDARHPIDGGIDASIDGGPEVCGNGRCLGGETCFTCPGDCGDCPVSCGDGACRPTAGEDCMNCPVDCGDCPVDCGNGVCAFPETCITCPADCEMCPPGCDHDVCTTGNPLVTACGDCPNTVCSMDTFCCTGFWDAVCVNEAMSWCVPPPICGPSCGDGACDAANGETCDSCPLDCGPCTGCEHALCDTGGPLNEMCDPCVTSICAVDGFCCTTMWDTICRNEVGTICGVPCAGCGDGLCAPGETCTICPTDCGPCGGVCGDGLCDATAGEDCTSCPGDCGVCPPICGNGLCETVAGETCTSCTIDCGPCGGCGDGSCSPGEDACVCPADCGTCTCAHDLCSPGSALNAGCDMCVASICGIDAFCCAGSWDGLCVNEVGTICGLSCPGPGCGDGVCSGTESCALCPLDCGPCAGCPEIVLPSTVPQTVTGTTTGASANTGGASCGGGGTAAPDVAYQFTAPSAGTYVFDTVGSSYDTLLYVRDGICTGSELACNDDTPGIGTRSRVTVMLAAGQTVIIVVDGFGASSGSYVLNITTPTVGFCGDMVCGTGESCATCPMDCGICPVPCVDEDLGSMLPVSVSGTTVGAGDDHGGAGCASGGTGAPERVYQWAVPMTGTYVFDTQGSSYDTLIYLLGADCAGPVLACNDDAPGLGTQSRITIALTGGQVLSVVVDGFGAGSGAYNLHINLQGGVCGDMICSSTETCTTCAGDCGVCPPGCPNGLCGATESCTTCPADCGVCPPTCGNGACDAGESCGTCPGDCGTCAGCGDGLCSGAAGETCTTCPLDCGPCVGCGDGACSPTESCSTCPLDCGPCAGCPEIVLPSIVPQTVTGTTVGATANTGGASCGGSGGGTAAPDVAYQFTAPTSGTYTFDTVGSTYDTLLYVRNASCTGSELACNDDTPGIGTQSRVTVMLSAGQVVVIVVDGFGSSSGSYVLNITSPTTGTCGDMICASTETCTTCPADCGPCGGCTHSPCTTGSALSGSCDSCAATVCTVDSFCCTVNWDGACVSEAVSMCGSTCPGTCGDFVCSSSETCSSCPTDCGICPSVCMNGICEPPTEGCSTCPADCGICPGTCGDGTCSATETCASCPGDCGTCTGTCSHDECLTGAAMVSGCDACVTNICATDSFCCTVSWDSICVSEAATICGEPCAIACPDGTCGRGETCSSCASDCGACACPHDVCTPGGPLPSTCSSCVASVCAIDSFCCSTTWDDRCINEAESTCGITCGGTCGDFTCGASENCTTCPADCGPCTTPCGDGFCTGAETCTTCPSDCGPCPVCGDGSCSFGEDCFSCPGDCGPCFGFCGDAFCDAFSGEDCTTCPLDCGTCGFCGDMVCDGFGGETCSSCPMDCGTCPPVCGDGMCGAGENCISCSFDCGPCFTCGDGFCLGGETCTSCPSDCGPCGLCGNGTCNPGENCLSCAADCSPCLSCGDGFCLGLMGENCTTCPSDCGPCP